MRKWLALVVAIVGVLALHPQAASRQSFLYVATPQTTCAGPGYPCPDSEVLVFDSETGGLVTRIPLIPGSAEHALVFSPDGRTLYAFGNKGTTRIDTTTHTATTLSLTGLPGGVRTGPLAMRRDGARFYAAAIDSLFHASVRTVDAVTGAVTTFADPEQSSTFVGGMATSPVEDRLYLSSAKPGLRGGLFEYDTGTEQELRRVPNINFAYIGPVALSPDGTRIYHGAPAGGARRIAVLNPATLTNVGEFTEPSAEKLYAGGRGRRLYSLAYTQTGSDYRLRIFDAVSLNPTAVAETVVVGATNVVAAEDESRVFVGTRSTVSSVFDGSAVNTTYQNRVQVFDAQSGQAVSTLLLPDSSWRNISGSPPPIPDSTMAMATTPPDAPRCSYRVGTTKNLWTTEGGTTTIALTTPCTWVASSDAPWVRLSQASGSSGATLTITVDPAVSASARAATLTIAGQRVTISQAGFGSVAPFGSFDTPVEGAGGVNGSLAVTGWALDDAGVTGIRIFRDPVAGEAPGAPVFIGHAPIVEGARPDVAAAFPTQPLNTRAGWGLNVLTNMLPNQGNGTFRLYAYIDDVEGHTTVLGPRTFTSSNMNVTVPFGAIDTPGQGETVAGTIVNFGWVLTPQPNIIPLDGSTIDVLIDGVVVGHPTYNNFRSDIAGLFPGLQNSNGAVGFFTIDTTLYNNGVHTIAWVVRDNAGNAAGIGSRYFTIQN